MKLIISSSPHITSKETTQSIMFKVIIATVPAMIASVLFFGIGSLLRIATSVIACVAFERGYEKLMKKPITVSDLSAVVTGVLLAFNVPSTMPLWMIVVGALVSIVVVKQLFGGIGFNFANPALVGRIVLSISYATEMTNFVFPKTFSGDAVASATPLAQYAAGTVPNITDMFIGTTGGVLGETSALAILIGFVFLVATKVISPVVPVTYVATVAVFAAILGVNPVVYVLGGGLLLGAVFMATDYTTTPYTTKGKLIYGVCLGLITVIIRKFGSMTEGVSYAILLMNLLLPYVNRASRQHPLGAPKKVKEAK